ncbi:Ferric enterobactin transport protein FepE [Marinomonas spartinae]|uniref:Wzz/FepE/Etk N-terminal domain-containing protein n=1 Tax=Marinomonas spartinae TaxID=1792290 RepID=UPI000808A75E|nr:Wzz/FepE/Etk N-terminal domain-containing protein [Marinomonas spartinae]SBS40406.1 Ferric enterobactin transport protein FepE [Marinomonas spartinae]
MEQTRQLQEPSVSRTPFQSDDEIDLKELLLALWKGKWIIIIAMIICTVGAVTYALLAKQVWTTEAIVTIPQISDFSNYRKVVGDLQPAFDIYQEDGTVLVSNKLNQFILPATLFDIFIQQFESRANKKAYISTASGFKEELNKLALEKPDDKKQLEDSQAILYAKWYQKLSALSLKSGNQEAESYTLKGEQNTSNKSLRFLNGYINYVAEKARAVALANIQSLLQSKQSELEQQQSLISDQAMAKLINERQRAQYALDIAKAAGINKPQQNLGSDEMFPINIGASALAAKVKILDALSQKQLTIIEPRLQQIQAKLSLLAASKIDNNLAFSTYQFVESPEAPLSRTSPKRPLIAILGVLLGGMLGCTIVLVRHAFRDK